MLESLFNKFAGLQSTLLNETPTQVFSCEICEIFQNTKFEEHPQTIAFITFTFLPRIFPFTLFL